MLSSMPAVSVLSDYRVLVAYFLAIIIPISLAALAIYRLFLAPNSQIPGPWYLKLTDAVLVYHEFYGTKRLWIHDLHQKHGPVVLLGPSYASFTSAPALKQIYAAGGAGFAKTEVYHLFKQEGHTNLFTAIDNKEHREKRKQFGDRYSNTNILRSKILDVIKDRADAFLSECTRDKSADIYLHLHGYALDCVTAMLFHPYGTRSIDTDDDREMIRLLSYHDSRKKLVLKYFFPGTEKLYNLLNPSASKGGSRINNYVWSSIRKGNHADFTLMARLLGSNNMDLQNIAAECLDHIGAGIDTTGDTLCFLMWELSQPRNSARMARLHRELSQGAYESLEKLPYLNAVINEGLRLWAPGTVSLPRYVPGGGKHIDGYFLPGGTVVSCQSYTTHRFESDVFPEPETFLPERWLDPKGETERNRLFFAFGGGARSCIGKHLAMAEMRALLYTVYSRMRTRPAVDMTASMELSDQLFTSRPEDMCCKLAFEPWEES
ncbi:hypothetical protein ACJ41O_005533 [Fusarium nematophilum]